jgi:hypothetical protein
MTMILQAIIIILFVGSLFMVAPSILSVVSTAMPVNATASPQLAQSFTTINGVATGGLNIGAIAFIALALGVMVAAFVLFMPRQQ